MMTLEGSIIAVIMMVLGLLTLVAAKHTGRRAYTAHVHIEGREPRFRSWVLTTVFTLLGCCLVLTGFVMLFR
ncbi:MAG TPA: hypothetical protein VGW38_00210 [Chloroflexota bacterium]|nr:hypothetical protein [Chloroflexota bacterium]